MLLSILSREIKILVGPKLTCSRNYFSYKPVLPRTIQGKCSTTAGRNPPVVKTDFCRLPLEMIFMFVVIVIAVASQIALISVFIGAGVYYLAEFVEEHTSITKKVIKWTIHVVIICHIGLYLFDNVSIILIASGLLSHIVYYSLLTDFPYFNLTSVSFILSVLLLIANHVLAFKFFQQKYTTLSEVFSYFTVCLWMVPFMFILSLSANDNTLPVTNVDDNVVSHYFTNRKRSYKIKNIFTYLGNITSKDNHLN